MPLMEFFPNATYVKPEFIQSCVELTSCISKNSDAAVLHLQGSLQMLLQRCRELEMSVCGAGTHPFCRRLALITPLPRYRNMAKESGYLAHRQITFSTHVHVGMASGDQAILVMSRLIPALSALIALSANSPFWRGHATGHATYRHRILAAAANYGLPTRFDDWRAFDEFLTAARRARMIRHFKDIHWDNPAASRLRHARAARHGLGFGFAHGARSCAFARCLILRLAEASAGEVSEVLPGDLPYWVEHQNRFRAGLRGLDAEYVVNKNGDHRPLIDVIHDLIEFCQPIAADIDETRGLQIARDLLDGPPGYQRQLDAYSSDDSARSVVKALQRSVVTTAGTAFSMTRSIVT